MKRFHSSLSYKLFLLVCALILLPGCDGGIFGTSDGDSLDAGSQEPSSPVAPESPDDTETPDGDVDATPPGVEPTAPDEADTVTDTDTDTSDNDNQIEPQAFENLQIGSNNQLPLLSLLNLSDATLNATSTPDSQSLFDVDIPPSTISETTELALETTALQVTNTENAESVLLLSPLNLAAFSVTTLIARNRPDAEAADSNNLLPSVEVIAIHSQQLSSDDGVARVRLLQLSPLDENDQIGSMSLVPAEGQPGGSQVELGTFSAANFGEQTDYRMADPGSYYLEDSLDRLTQSSVELLAGEFYTLILWGDPAELGLLQDSQGEN